MLEARHAHRRKLLSQIKRAVNRNRRFALFSHEEPDGDAIGSQVAFTLALKTLGKDVSSFRVDAIPPALEFLGRGDTIEKYRPRCDRKRIEAAEVIIIGDCSGYFRLGELAPVVKSRGGFVINIDHHRDNEFFGDINYVRFTAGGTAELVFEILQALGVLVRGAIAEALYTGLSTDTVDFRYIDPEGNMIGMISELIRGGVRITELQEKIYCHRPATYFRDLARVIRRVRYGEQGALAWFILPRSRHLSFYERELASEVLKQLLSIRAVRAAIMIHREKAGIEVWLRSKLNVDVGRAAKALGGGGHRTAAGALIRGRTLKETVPLVLSEVASRMR